MKDSLPTTPLRPPEHPIGYETAWRIARENFGNHIFFYAPTLKHYETEEFRQSCSRCYFMPASITGIQCELNCDHCGRKILTTMRAAVTPDELFAYAERIARRGAKGMLISGGSSREGVVPIRPFIKTLGRIKQAFGFKIVAHLGILDRTTVQEMKDTDCIDGAMMDIVGSNDTLRQVYHLSKVTIEDFEKSLSLLCEYGVKSIPHIVIGLHYGRIVGEYRALEMISRYPVASLVLVCLFPQPGTKMADITPPGPDDMGDVFKQARHLFPKIPLLLGCERPLGEHKHRTDVLALKAGLNGIAYPSEGIATLANKMGLTPHFSEMCCSLLYQEAIMAFSATEFDPCK